MRIEILEPGYIFKTVRNFLFSTANREFLIFLFFLALSGVFWLLMTLNETYDVEVRIPVRYVNVPSNVVLTSGETDTMRVTVSDKGIILAAYLYGKAIQPVTVDIKGYSHNGQGIVPQADLRKMAQMRLLASSKISTVKPDRMVFYYNNGEKKRVPVHYSGQVIPSNVYYLAGVNYFPDSVTIYAAQDKLDSISLVYTEPLNYTNVHDTLNVQARLRRIDGVKVVPEVVDIRFLFDVLSELTIEDVPIKGINMPEGKVLRTFPSKVTVRFVTGLNRYRTLTRDDFEVVADYNQLQNGMAKRCTIYLNQSPDGISNVKLDTTQVDYLIEE